MDLRRLQACISKMEHEICAKVDENDLQYQARKQDLSNQDTRKEDPQAEEKEKHLPDCSTEKYPEAQINDNNLLARIREKWAAKQGLASILGSDGDSSNSGDIVSLNIESSGDIHQKDRLHPASSTPADQVHLASSTPNVLHEGINMTSSRGCDVRPKDRLRSSLSTDDTQRNSLQNMFASKRADERFLNKQYNVANVQDNDQSWQCRQKARSMPKKSEASSEASSKVNDFECEVFQEGEESANGKWKSCKKYPGHKDFIPFKEFTIQHLPKAYRTNTFYKGVKSVARVTVRLRVKYTSKDRPDGYLFSNVRGTRLSHTGSGVIFSRFFSEKIKGKEVSDNLTEIGTEESDPNGVLASTSDGRKRLTKYILKSMLKAEDRDGKLRKIIKFFMKPDAREAGGLKGLLKLGCDLLPNYESDDGENMSFDEPDSDYDVNADQCRLHLFGLNSSHNLKEAVPDSTERNKNGPSHAAEDENDKVMDDFFDLAPFNLLGDKFVHPLLSHSNTEKDFDSDADEDFDDHVDDEDHEKYILDNLNKLDDKDLQEPEEDTCAFGVVSPCCCPDCKMSNSPEPKGYYINVLTARHVVFDKEEAENTVVELFCDDDSENSKITLSVIDVHLYYHTGDMVILMCATHDLRLILKLEHLVEDMLKNIEKMTCHTKNTPLAIICSHPHGNFKHVTVGEWTQRNIHGRPDGRPVFWTNYFYNTPTCPGSSGGPVITLGHKSWMMELNTLIHLHHGHHEENINKSSRFISFGSDYEKKHFIDSVKRRKKKQKREAGGKNNIDLHLGVDDFMVDDFIKLLSERL